MKRTLANYDDPALDVTLTFYANETLADRMQALAIASAIEVEQFPAEYGVQAAALTWVNVLPVLEGVVRRSGEINTQGDALCEWFAAWDGSTDYPAAWAAYCPMATDDIQLALTLGYNATRRNRLIAPPELRASDAEADADPTLKKSALEP